MPASRSVTIIDVAQFAGLSPTTVSRVLNKSGYYSEDTLRKVEAAAAALNYRPNWSARSLKGKPTRLVGLIIPDISNVFYTHLAATVAGQLRDCGYEMILCVSDEEGEKDLGYLQILEEKRIDGILYVHPSGGNNSEFLRGMVARGMPVIEINRQREKDLLDAVLPDNLRAVQQAVEYLIKLGHRRIALVSGETSMTTGSERVLAYQGTLSSAGLPLDPVLLKVGTFTRQFGEQATRELLTLPEPPTAIFAGSNRISLGVLVVINELRLCIPDDVSVVVFDDTEWLAAWNPPITAVDIAIGEMAKLAVELLQRRMNGEGTSAKPVTYHLGTSMIIRQSCKDLAQVANVYLRAQRKTT